MADAPITIDDTGITREEKYYAVALGELPISKLPQPLTRKENYWYKIAVAVSSGGGGDISEKVAEEVAKLIADAPEDFDTLKEISDWIYDHEDSAAAMNSAIQENARDISNLQAGKIDKESGKGLSTNDFTTAEKTKLAGLENYDDTEIKVGIAAKQNALTTDQLNAVNSGITYGKVANYDDVYAVLNYNALNHNCIFRGKDLTNIYTVEQIYSMVSSGKFDDLYLGDYFTVSITTTLPDGTVKTENVSLMIAGFNYYYNYGDTALTKYHIVLIPRTRFATTAKMNSTNTTAGGYLNSYMHQTVLPCYAESLQTALSNHVLTYRDCLTNTVNTTTPSMAGAGLNGAITNWEWTDVTLQLMSEAQVYGTNVCSSSWRDTGTANKQLPVFKYINPQQYGRYAFWLRSVVSTTTFAYCYSNGDANYNSASIERYVRPLILFG